MRYAIGARLNPGDVKPFRLDRPIDTDGFSLGVQGAKINI